MPTTASYDGGMTEGGEAAAAAAAAAASSRVVGNDGDQTKPALASVDRRRMINEPRICVKHPLLL